ncbi:hypothetical protein [uncultured Oscillibacter sp.]|uniref:hypothetical protein n=1 Tax=uncultured Oscillibacter sp. TaxID=876091 RepID=UPI0025F10A78|nr:hypothetical protein [uncultured Oscillibacter sp.]
MAYVLSPEDKAFFEEILKKAEPYPEDDPIWDVLDGERDHSRAMATLAKMALEGRLR